MSLIPECPACSNHKGTEVVPCSVYRCGACEALFGSLYLGDSYTHVSPFLTAEQVPADRQRYFDFTCLGSNGITRRHGWYDPQTRLMTQVG